ncbi:hypothetical protein [Burkholderia vietnamiensis]|uniref:hypothetical protein n=1 Tax=Burkholderia vietnamiensis TaxID=60552 RepID=UPI001CC59528|nr:hypothetical protein [Burkholderia vietnamiensis]
MPQNIRRGWKAVVIDCLLDVIVGPVDGRAFHIARSMPAFRKPSSHCFYCISHNAEDKEIRHSGFPENIRPVFRTDFRFRRTIQCRAARPASTRGKSRNFTPASRSARFVWLPVVSIRAPRRHRFASAM